MAYGKVKRDDISNVYNSRLLLRAARRNKNLSIRELGKLSNLDFGFLGKCEKGTCEISVVVAKRLANILMVSNWWELCERFKYDVDNDRYIGDNGTIIEIRGDNDLVHNF